MSSFQYTFSRHIANSLGAELFISTRLLQLGKGQKDIDNLKIKVNGIDLNSFVLKTKFSDVVYRFFQRVIFHYQCFRKIEDRISKVHLIDEVNEISDLFPRYEIVRRNRTIKLRGYGQNSRIIADILVNEENSFTLEPINSSTAYLELLQIFTNSQQTAIQIRGADFKLLSDSVGLLAETYFLEAIHELNAEKSLIWIFTDDIAYAKRLLENKVERLRFISEVATLTLPEELKLMSLSHKLIISNSTFGWWGGRLGKPKIVMYPSPWNITRQTVQPVFPKNWIGKASSWQ